MMTGVMIQSYLNVRNLIGSSFAVFEALLFARGRAGYLFFLSMNAACALATYCSHRVARFKRTTPPRSPSLARRSGRLSREIARASLLAPLPSRRGPPGVRVMKELLYS